MCSTSSSLRYKRGSNCVPPTSLQSLLHRWCWVSSTWPNQNGCLVRISIAPCSRTIRSSSDVTGVPYTILFILAHRKWSRGVRSGDHAGHGTDHPLTSINPSIWICNVEMIPHISIKVHIWLKDCIPSVLGQQNESEQIATPVRSQTLTIYSTQTVRLRGSFLNSDQLAGLHNILSIVCFWDTLYIWDHPCKWW